MDYKFNCTEKYLLVLLTRTLLAGFAVLSLQANKVGTAPFFNLCMPTRVFPKDSAVKWSEHTFVSTWI